MEFFFFTLGCVLGSFANAYFYRRPREIPIAWERSFCPHCHKQIAFYDNIPIISFVLLGGRCRSCKTKISIWYPSVELLCGGLFLTFFLMHGILGIFDLAILSWGYILFLLAGTDLSSFFYFDREFGILPDELTVLLALVGYATAPWNPYVQHSFLWSLLGAIASGGTVWGLRAVFSRIYGQEAMGLGDVKLMAAAGFFLGARGSWIALWLAALIGGAIMGAMLLHRRVNRRTAIPFGPFLAIGCVSTFFFLGRI